MTTTQIGAEYDDGSVSRGVARLRAVPSPDAGGDPRAMAWPLRARVSGLTAMLLGVDAAAAVAAVLLVGLNTVWSLATVAVILVCRGAGGVHRRRLQLSYVADLPRALGAAGVAFGILAAAVLLLHTSLDHARTVGLAVVLFCLLASLPRAAVFQAGRIGRTRYGRAERTVVIGTGAVAVDLAAKMTEHPEFGLAPVGFVDDAPPSLPTGVPYLGRDVVEAARRTRAGVVVVAYTEAARTDLVDLAITAHRMHVSLLVLPRLFEIHHDMSHVERLRSYPLVRLNGTPTGRPSWWIKVAFDRIVAALALLVLSPVLAASALAVLLESGRPILFRQQRVGLDGRLFSLYKLRSMRPADEQESGSRWSIAGDPRVGPVGRFLRRSSLDELPQLWNILRGDMSIVGPRPERPTFVERFSEEHERYWARHRVPTGLTGLAQVNGLRGDTSIADRARYDNYYIANWSLWLDVRIVLMTARELLRRGQH